jgi:hypothetical protein
MTPLAIIDWDALLNAIWASAAAGIGVTAAYGLAILGGTRAVELGRAGRPGEAVLFLILGIGGVAVVIGGIVFGIVVLTE